MKPQYDFRDNVQKDTKTMVLANHDEQITAKAQQKITLDESARLDLSLPSSWVVSGFAPPTHNSPLKVVRAITFGTGLLDCNFKLAVVWSTFKPAPNTAPNPTPTPSFPSAVSRRVLYSIMRVMLAVRSPDGDGRTELSAQPETSGKDKPLWLSHRLTKFCSS